jgi:small-conductance mechanosensitive channel
MPPEPPPLTEKELLDLEAQRLENEAKRVKLEAELIKIEQMRAPPPPPPEPAPPAVNEAKIKELQDGLSTLAQAVQGIMSTVEQMSTEQQRNAEKAMQVLERPKRIVREKGRITRIEVE